MFSDLLLNNKLKGTDFSFFWINKIYFFAESLAAPEKRKISARFHKNLTSTMISNWNSTSY